jgi:hypothetical protein
MAVQNKIDGPKSSYSQGRRIMHKKLHQTDRNGDVKRRTFATFRSKCVKFFNNLLDRIIFLILSHVTQSVYINSFSFILMADVVGFEDITQVVMKSSVLGYNSV